LWDEIQDLDLGLEDPALFIPHEAYVYVEEFNRLSIIARPLNPRVQNLNAVIAALPRCWGLTVHVHGRILDATYVQFLFQNEIDLQSVQRREPWLFNNWFVATQRWELAPALNFVTSIDLWVQIRGIPLSYVCEETALDIARDLGEVIMLDHHDATSTQITYIRVRVRFGITNRLRFFQRIIFNSGEVVTIRFQYERLRRICSSCFRFTHYKAYCPYRPRPHSIARERAAFRDSVHRSSLNSQSQMTETSFPAPVTPPPRIAQPQLNPEELRAAYPYYASVRDTHTLHVGESSTARQQWSSGSSTTPTRADLPNHGNNRVFEVGQSSRRQEVRREAEDPRLQTRQNSASRMGEILKPPKKR